MSKQPGSSVATDAFDLTCGIDLKKYRTISSIVFRENLTDADSLDSGEKAVQQG